MQSNQPTVRRILFSALAALTVGLGAASLIAGFSDSFPVRLLQGIAIFASGAVIVGGAVVLAMIRLAGWRDPESEIDFEALVQRTERLASYGLYQGDTVAQDYFHDRIVIFRDTLVRDFGHDPDLLRAQVTRTLRHELAHHLGWDEKGVRGLGL